MKNTIQPLRQVVQKFSRILPAALLSEMALESGFAKRKARKLTAFHFVLSFFICCSKQLGSLSEWAAQLFSLCGEQLSKQGLDYRLGKGSALFASKLLCYLLKLKSQVSRECKKAVACFSGILVQDSTTFSLQDSLQKDFKGSVSRGVQKAVLRLKIILDLCMMQVVYLGITAYSENDQAAASNIHALVRKGMLVIRDLGYWSTDSFEKIAGRGAYFLSRLKYGVSLYDLKQRALDLQGLLKGRVVDRWVLLSKQNKLAVRLLIVPLPIGVAEQRARRAKYNRDRRLQHSKDYYHFIRYNIFVTNVAQQQCTARQLNELYGLRWQIEVFFKALKSGAMHLREMISAIRTNAYRVRTVVALALCFVVITLQKLYTIFKEGLSPGQDHFPSLLKLLKWMVENLQLYCSIQAPQLAGILLHYCCYEKRKRQNHSQKLQALT